MRDDNLKATTQYKDFTGTVSADIKDLVFLEHLAERYQVDTQKYYIFGINIYLSEFGNLYDRAIIDMLAVDRSTIDVTDNDSIQKYINSHNGTLPYVKIRIKTYLEETLEYFKRFDIVLTYENIKADNYELKEQKS